MYFQANAAAPDLDCIEVAVFMSEEVGNDVSTPYGLAQWQAYYAGCVLFQIMH